MRTTLDIDEDVLQAAKELARADGKTAGQVISELARKALTTPYVEAPAGFLENSAGEPGAYWPTFPDRGGVIVTPELIERIIEVLDLEDAEIKDFTKEGSAG